MEKGHGGREDVTVSYTVTETVPGKAPVFTDAGEYTVDYYLVTNPPRYIPGTTRYYGDVAASSEKVTIGALTVDTSLGIGRSHPHPRSQNGRYV